MVSPRDRDVLSISGWPGGINNRSRETENVNLDNRLKIPVGQSLRGAMNVDLTVQGKPLRRRGYALSSAGFTHSLWRLGDVPFALMVRDGYLCSISGLELAITQLRTVDTVRPMSYAVVNQQIYFSNGLDKGTVDFNGTVEHWGIALPALPVLSAAANLGLNAGTYQVAVTYRDSAAVEGGASDVATIDVAQGAGFTVTLQPAPPEAAYTCVYVTQANSEVFTLYAMIPTATLSLNVGMGGMGAGRVLETLNLEPPIPSDIVRYYNGRLYFAVGSAVFFTEALRYGLVRYAQNVYMMPSEVTLLEPSENGVYVGYGDSVVFIQGDSPYEVKHTQVNSRGPVAGTGTRVPGHFLDRGEEYIPVWWTQRGGMVAGLPGGETLRLTEDRLAVPTFGAGAILAREYEGMRHLVSALRQPGQNSCGASDSVVAEIRRNAVTT
jgi:hypothetical protein